MNTFETYNSIQYLHAIVVVNIHSSVGRGTWLHHTQGITHYTLLHTTVPDFACCSNGFTCMNVCMHVYMYTYTRRYETTSHHIPYNPLLYITRPWPHKAIYSSATLTIPYFTQHHPYITYHIQNTMQYVFRSWMSNIHLDGLSKQYKGKRQTNHMISSGIKNQAKISSDV